MACKPNQKIALLQIGILCYSKELCMLKSIQQGFKTTSSENGKMGWEFPLPDKGQAADSRREVSQALHFSCLCALWFRLVEAGNYPSF